MSKSTTSKPVAKQGQPDLSVLATSSRSLVYSGPLPTASEMAQYEKICTGAADRIITMAEKQSEHRQKVEYDTILTANWRSILGVIFAFIIALASIILCGYCVHLDHLKTACAIFGGTIVSLVSVFIYGTNSNKQEREEKFDKAHQLQMPLHQTPPPE